MGCPSENLSIPTVVLSIQQQLVDSKPIFKHAFIFLHARDGSPGDRHTDHLARGWRS